MIHASVYTEHRKGKYATMQTKRENTNENNIADGMYYQFVAEILNPTTHITMIHHHMLQYDIRSIFLRIGPTKSYITHRSEIYIPYNTIHDLNCSNHCLI